MDWIPVVQRICSLFVVGFVVFTYYCILKQDKAAKQKKAVRKHRILLENTNIETNPLQEESFAFCGHSLGLFCEKRFRDSTVCCPRRSHAFFYTRFDKRLIFILFVCCSHPFVQPIRVI